MFLLVCIFQSPVCFVCFSISLFVLHTEAVFPECDCKQQEQYSATQTRWWWDQSLCPVRSTGSVIFHLICLFLFLLPVTLFSTPSSFSSVQIICVSSVRKVKLCSVAQISDQGIAYLRCSRSSVLKGFFTDPKHNFLKITHIWNEN